MALRLSISNGIPLVVSSAVSTYDATFTSVSIVTAGTNITLPSSGTYLGVELQVYLNDARLESVLDYNYVGSGTRTQITLTFDLQTTDRLRFVTIS